MGDNFWIENPTAIFKRLSLFPQPEMTERERLNSLTRLIIVLSLLMKFIGFGSWLSFLIMGIIMTVLIFYISIYLPESKNKVDLMVENYIHPSYINHDMIHNYNEVNTVVNNKVNTLPVKKGYRIRAKNR